MRAVLGIDAAWTETNPSGVAVAVETPTGWKLVAAEPSYQRFIARSRADMKPELRPSGSLPSAQTLLDAARILSGGDVSLIAVDMPLSRTTITGRRTCDNAVSRAYGRRKCGTHSPSRARPGSISDRFRESFEAAGFPLQTAEVLGPGVIEVYPHPALVELAGAPERLAYKVAKSRAYWPSLSSAERRSRLLMQWSRIIGLLDVEVQGVSHAFEGFEQRTSGTEMKATEDALDAVVCAWVAIRTLNGRAIPYGDMDSAIWIPSSNPNVSVSTLTSTS